MWGSGRIPADQKERYQTVSLSWKEMLGSLLGFRGRQAPNQITGFLCDMFLSFERRPAVLDCIRELNIWREDKFSSLTETEVDNYSRLLEGLSVIGRVAASQGRVKLLKLRQFCQDYHLFLVTTWPWILMSESVHRLVDHLWELVLLNGNRGLATQSEQSLESTHKVN